MPRRRRGGASKRPAGAGPAEARQTTTAAAAAEAERREEHAAKEEEEVVDEEGLGAGELPWEVWVNVLQFVSCGDVVRFGLACRLFSAIADIGMVWRSQARRDCWRALERWGEDVVDPARVGWRTAYQAYDRLRWARLLAAQCQSLSAGKADKLARSKHRSSFSVEADMSCFAVDEQSFTTPGTQRPISTHISMYVVAVGVFGRNATYDSVVIWRKGPPTPSAPKWVTRWDRNDGQEGWHLWRGVKGHASTVSCAQFVDGTDRLITGSWDKTIKVWQNVCDEGKEASCATTLSGHKFEVTCLRRHKSLLVSGSQDKTVSLWDLEASKQVLSFVGHTLFVEDVLFDKEGVRLMSASMDQSVRVWDPRVGPAEIARYAMSAPVRSLALNHEGDCLYFCPNPHDRDWIELRAADRKVARARAAFWSAAVRYTSKMALSPFRLENDTDYAVFGGALVSLPPAGKSVASSVLMCYDAKRSDLVAFSGRRGVCWTNSQVIVTGDTTRIWMADVGGAREFAVDPDADENGQSRQRLQPENGAGKAAASHLSASTPTSEEVARDVARIQRQIAEIRRGNRTTRRR